MWSNFCSSDIRGLRKAWGYGEGLPELSAHGLTDMVSGVMACVPVWDKERFQRATLVGVGLEYRARCGVCLAQDGGSRGDAFAHSMEA